MCGTGCPIFRQPQISNSWPKSTHIPCKIHLVRQLMSFCQLSMLIAEVRNDLKRLCLRSPAFRRLNPKNGSQTQVQLSGHYMEVS